MNPSLDSVADELRSLEAEGLLRAPAAVRGAGNGRPGPAGRPAPLLACTNDYLGLSGDPRLAAAAAEAAAREGTGAGASRLVTGTRPAHVRLEAQVAAFTGADAALTFGSGFAANLAALGSLLGRDDLAISDARNHASLVDGLRLCRAERRIVAHADAAAVRRALADRPRFRRAVIVTEGLFSMDGDEAPLANLATLAEEHGALLYVDDAHGTGVLGATGRGAPEAHGVGPAPWLVRMGTFGKAFGASGAFVAGDPAVVRLVATRGRAFIYTTAPSPAIAAAASAGLTVAAAEPGRRSRCLTLAGRLRAGLAERGVASLPGRGPIVPVLIGDVGRALTASRRLLEEHGVVATAIRPPSVPRGTSRFRLAASAAQTEDDADRVAGAVAEVLR